MIEIDWLLDQLVSFTVGTTLAGIVVYRLSTKFLVTYLNKKGENLATKEDIEHITDLVKGVEHQYNLLLEEKKITQQLRMAALDKRLQAHQEAFTLWRRLIASNASETSQAVMNCQTWWEQNCLYLQPDVRQAFTRAYASYNVRQQLLDAHASVESVKQAWADVTKFPEILFNAIQLPGLSKTEKETIGASEDDAV